VPIDLNTWRTLAVALCASLAITAAVADERATQNAEFLARADSANSRCKVLGGTDAQDLSGMAAAASQTEETRIAARRGAQTGASVRCDETAARGIKGVLDSARSQGLKATIETAPVEAVVNTPQVSTDNETKKVEPLPIAEETSASTVNLVTPPKSVKKKPVQPLGQPGNAQLKRYEIMAAAYFKQLKCPTMSRRELVAFYENVIEAHRKSVAIYGSAKVSQTVRAAASRTKAGNC
jgi:hypothetical protein